ncbi:UDP-N-acetylmuramoyl-tripeptide--D-alanyl-D-alanine ligase [Dermatobacter hominis]|uniref:UDP-N-acetylmuramoyl-tripeptide--D-alanyl-D- alanine ligase n=1 Tax=Dermatobacter hominis TaxID=2884263 RepID=UPI001D10781F|nr:UDP-N-acetylmuramoyl-tripeptide--D-alanyl-D-alanine ligase [Dermatobacter hominis]UDY36077.1 UDP-N-acetylmuramoyl-tripeptide--D-alanyl-D-alanine ligase [Dermatobacter hominis]
MEIDAADLARRLGGTLHAPARAEGLVLDGLAVDGLAIDSRLVRPGQVFAALVAERDGHDFVPAAFDAGAALALVERVDAAWDGPSLEVPSVTDALAELAQVARDRLPDRVVGVTGSVGKTTTKDLLANVAGRAFATVASEKSFNNELGVPLTLANAPAGTEAAVIEMGARGVGHIRLLCELARPTVGVVTVVEGVHTEVMGSIEQIAVAKRELVEHLPAEGAAVLNAGDPNVSAMAAHTVASVVTFGDGGEVHATDVSVDDELRARFTLRSPWGDAPVQLAVRGAHNVTNALAAAAAGLWLGVAVDGVVAGLAEPPASPWRMELVRVPGGPTVLNDAYNAGPASMAAALQALAALAVAPGGRRLAVLGVMAELGPEGPDEHRRIAALAGELGIEVLAVGTDLYGVTDVVAGAEDVAGAVGELGPDDAVLVKGSRVAGLERAAAALTRRGR